MTTEPRPAFGPISGGHGTPAPVGWGDPVVPFVRAVTSAFIIRTLGKIPPRTHAGGGWTLDALAR